RAAVGGIETTLDETVPLQLVDDADHGHGLELSELRELRLARALLLLEPHERLALVQRQGERLRAGFEARNVAATQVLEKKAKVPMVCHGPAAVFSGGY